MIATILFLILLILLLSEAFLKASFFKYINMVITSVFGVIFAFNFYETLAKLMISNNIIPLWANSACFVLLFAITFGVLFAISEALTKEAPKLPPVVIKITSMACATLFTFILTGIIVIAMSMGPIKKTWPYPRIKADLAVSAATIDRMTSNAMPATDSMLTGFFGMLSSGSLSSEKSFGYVHADFTNANFLNRYCLEDGTSTICGSDGILIDSKRLKVIRAAHSRLRDSKNEPVKPEDGMKLVQLTFEFSKKAIEDGGSFGEDGKLIFSLSQLRLLCSETPDKTSGDVYVAYPIGLINADKKLERKFLTDAIAIEKADFGKDKTTKTMIAVFAIPENQEASSISFRQNFVKMIPKAKKSDDDSLNDEM